MILPVLGKAVPKFLGSQMQLAFVVPDFHRAMSFWTETMGVGPFVVIEDAMNGRRFMHRGKPTPVQSQIGFAYVGEIQIEVIAQTNDAPSPYREFLDAGRQGLHHVAYWPERVEEARSALARAGYEEICSVEVVANGSKVTYHDGPPDLGVMLEIAAMTPDRVRYFGGIKALADRWDGTRPVRTFRSRAEYMASPDCPAVAANAPG